MDRKGIDELKYDIRVRKPALFLKIGISKNYMDVERVFKFR